MEIAANRRVSMMIVGAGRLLREHARVLGERLP